ncbi:MAG TPA: hypothetical protein DCS48_00670 [Desulfovibrio sp.]|nr:hypothetical protein [Desulfovibrio sp.]
MASFFGNKKSESIKKIINFRDELKNIKWNRKDDVESLSTMFNSLDAVAEEKLQYYYGRRKRRAFFSNLFRNLGWVAGFIGVILPLLSDYMVAFDPTGKLGYVFLIAAASFLGANSLFEGTSGHVRYVMTQLKLEKLIVSTRLSWHVYKSRASCIECSEKEVADGFAIIQKYAQEFYDLVIDEADDWGESVLKELIKYQKSIDKNSKLKDGV